MGGSCDVKIEIDRSYTGGTFSNNDIIKGVVILIVKNSISLNYIQVKLEGLSKTQLTIPGDRKDKNKKDKQLFDLHKVLYDSCIVFPPNNIRKLSQAKEFTLTPGNYSYPFEFKIPMNNSCIKLEGISNKVLFNVKNLDLSFSTSKLNSSSLKGIGQKYYSHYTGNGKTAPVPHEIDTSPYHITSVLPPSLSGLNEFASIRYFVKVTCKRSSFLKTNLRSIDPFTFLPLDLDSQNRPLSGDYDEYKEEFIRRELIFKDRIPDILAVKVPAEATEKKELPNIPVVTKKQNMFQKFLGQNAQSQLPPVPMLQKSNSKSYYPEIESKDVPFSFEVRFRHPAFLIPTKSPSFKLYLVSNLKPSRYSLGQYGRPDESNGLGIVYLQKLIIDLKCTTIISVIDNEGSSYETHKGKHEDVVNICKNSYKNLKFDLVNCKKSKSSAATSSDLPANGVYELEIPKKYFENAILPDYLAPSFKTCNITRSYSLTIVGGFTCEKIIDFRNSKEVERKIKYVDLQSQNIKVLSGLTMTDAQHSNSPSLRTFNKKSSDFYDDNVNGKTAANTQCVSQQPNSTLDNFNTTNSFDTTNSTFALEQNSPLPTYDEVMRQSIYQSNDENQRARRRFHQSN